MTWYHFVKIFTVTTSSHPLVLLLRFWKSFLTPMKTSPPPLGTLSCTCLSLEGTVALMMGAGGCWGLWQFALCCTYCNLSFFWPPTAPSSGLHYTHESYEKPNKRSQKQPTDHLRAFWYAKQLLTDVWLQSLQSSLCKISKKNGLEYLILGHLSYFYGLMENKDKTDFNVFVIFEFCVVWIQQ